MADHLPILVFPTARSIPPSRGNSAPPGKLHFPKHARQVGRLSSQLQNLQQDFSHFKASASGCMAGLEPETVLVIEIIGSVNDFKLAVDNTEGLEWMGEWDVEDIESDDDFYIPPKIGVDFFKNKIDGITSRAQSKEIKEILEQQTVIDDKGVLLTEDIPALSWPSHLSELSNDIIEAINDVKKKSLKGRVFLSLSNEKGLNELLSLWKQWENEQKLPIGKTKWRDVFNQLLKIRRWGIEETLYETGMVDRWKDLTEPVATNPASVTFQIELFYRKEAAKRNQNERLVTSLLVEINGERLSPFIDMEAIAFHAVKVKLPAEHIQRLLEKVDSSEESLDIQLFKFPGIMYFRPTGQSITALNDETGEASDFHDEGKPESPPVVAILDGVPNLQHKALKDRLLFDDPDNLSAFYQPGERRHGTSIASLVVHGELSDGGSPLSSHVYHLPVMQPNPDHRSSEYFPDDVFFEDRIERAVRRILQGEGNVPAQAPGVKIINISLGDPERPFIHSPSPWARLLDWLSFKYYVLFCVSAGNYLEDINTDLPDNEFQSLSDSEKVNHLTKCIDSQLSERRLISPAESINSLTVGALHIDESGDFSMGQRQDLLPGESLFSPVSRFGHGFRRSIKPEIFFPGGRQLYHATPNNQSYRLVETLNKPGQQVAWDSSQQGILSETVHTRGTSNSAALATRSGAKIYEVLSALQKDHGEQIQDDLIAVLIKTLLVHGAKHNNQAKEVLINSLKTPANSRRIKEVVSRYLGYGSVDIERVLACTEQRGTVIGCGEIQENEVHEYRFPLPEALSEQQFWRRMVITMAWFSPINPANRNLREANLSFNPPNDSPLKIKRVDSDNNQVQRGTVQHEVLEGKSQISAFREDSFILLNINCKADATTHLDQKIPYGLAVTLEVEEDVNIPVYSQIRDRIKPQVAVDTNLG
jgi:hypothetical protein